MNLTIEILKNSKGFFAKYGNAVSIILIGIVSLCYIIFSAMANADLAEGRFALFMDELITFDGVKKILHPDGWGHFIYSIVDGGDHRYGRILWNILSIVSFIPERIFGEKGQIFASRMFLSLSLLSSYLILSITFLRNNVLRLIALVLLLSLPFTAYYSTMPKPEPLQLLFLSLFLVFAIRKEFLFGFYWIFLGLALALKVSLLPVVLFVIVFSFYKEIRNHSWYKFLFSSSMVATGFIISELYLLKTIIYRTMDPVKDLITSILVNARFAGDDRLISFSDWFLYIIRGYTRIPPWLMMTILIICTLFVLFYVMHYFSKNGNKRFLYRVIDFFEDDGVIFLIFGMLMMFPVVVFIKRVWGFYLHAGTVFLTIGFLIISEKLINIKILYYRYLGISILILFSLTSLLFCTPHTLLKFKKLSKRTQNELYIKRYEEYLYIKDFLKEISPYINRKINVYYDPVLFSINSTDKFKIVPFWGHFIHYEHRYDIIIFEDKHTPEGKLPAETNVSYPIAKLEKEMYKTYVIKKDKPLYYNILDCELTGIEILVRGDLYPQIKHIGCGEKNR